MVDLRSLEYDNDAIFTHLKGNRRLISRLGSTEYQILMELHKKNRPNNFSRKLRHQLLVRKSAWISAGIWPPTRKQFERFAFTYVDALQKSTLLAIWNNQEFIPNEEAFLRKLTPAPTVSLSSLDPVYLIANGIRPWTQILENKKILVVHQQSQLIKEQYAKRRKLHKNYIIPEFELSVLQPPQTNGLTLSCGNWSSHFLAFTEKNSKYIDENKFDVALVAAGGYGVPISEYLMKKDINSVYMGGSLQLLFGIWGSRWRGNQLYSKVATDNWVTPSPNQRPSGYKLVEKSSYW